MITNRITQLIYRTIYCVLMGFGILLSTGLFTGSQTFNTDFYVYYTNLSNYFCFGVMVAILVKTVQRVRAGEKEGSDDFFPNLKFVAALMILVTCLVYNGLLAKDYSAKDYFLGLNNLIMHLVGPIMFILDFVLFGTRRRIKWFIPLVCIAPPLAYCAFIYIRAAILGFRADTLYPYFFLDADTLGAGGVIVWIAILLVVFVFLGYLMWLFNRSYRGEDGKVRFDFGIEKKRPAGILSDRALAEASAAEAPAEASMAEACAAETYAESESDQPKE